jgi:hypothetical protein
MKKKNSGHIWAMTQTVGPDVFSAEIKTAKISEVTEKIKEYEKLLKKVSKIIMRSNRMYLYEQYEKKSISKGAHLIKPLIDGKYIECMYARITLHDIDGWQCTLECQRFNDQWMPLYTGSLDNCLKAMEIDDGWF